MFYATENLTPGKLSPFSNLLEHQRFASYLAWSAGNAPDITISPDARKLTYKDKTLDVTKWQLGLRQLHNDIKGLVAKLLRGNRITVTVPDDTPDNMAESAWGYSWIHNSQFTEPHALLRALMHDKEMNLCTVTEHGELVWNVAAMTEWMLVAKELNTSLCVETHCVPGQVSRASELCDGRIINGLRGRNLFRIQGSTWWINRRVKSEHLVHHESFIPLKFPPEMEEILHVYLLVIRPVEIEFARHLWGQETAALYHEYMWVTMDHRLMEERFSRELESYTEKYCGCGLSVRPYRQIVVALSRAYLGSEGEIEEEDSDALVEQRGHSVEMSRTHYGRRVDRLQCLTDDVLVRFGRVSEAWWRLVGFYPGNPPLLPVDQRRQFRLANKSTDQNEQYNLHQTPISAPAFNSEALVATMEAMISNALTKFGAEMRNEIRTAVASGFAAYMDRQPPANPAERPVPAQQPYIPVLHAAQQPHILVSPSPSPSPATPASDLHQPASTPLSPILPPAPASSQTPPGPLFPPFSSIADYYQPPGSCAHPFGDIEGDGVDSMEEDEEDRLSYFDEAPAELSVPPTLVREKNTLGLLQELLSNERAAFKSPGQETVVNMALAAKENLIAVMRTGGGKSMSYLVPAYADQLSGRGMTIAVIPNKVLLADVLRQTARLGIKSSVWLASKPVTTDTHLVLMAVETVTSPKFHE